MLDSHIHLARLPQAAEVCADLKSLGYEAISVACAPWEWVANEKLIPIMGIAMTPTFGLHPMEIENAPEGWESQISMYLTKYPNAWVGECGLDKRFPGYEKGGIQEAVFKRQAKIALAYARPLVIHCLGDYRRMFDILENVNYPKETSPILLHRFGGDMEIVRRGIRMRALFSIHADSIQNKSTREALRIVPRDLLRYETDADETFVPRHFTTKKANPSEIAHRIMEELTSVTLDFI